MQEEGCAGPRGPASCPHLPAAPEPLRASPSLTAGFDCQMGMTESAWAVQERSHSNKPEGWRPGVPIMDVGEHYGGAAKLSQKTGLLWVRETFQEWQQDTAVLISNYPQIQSI